MVGRAIGVYRESRLRIWVRMVKYLVTTPCPAPRPRWSRSSKTRYRTTLRSRYRSSPGPLAPPLSRISSRNLPRNQQGNCILELIFTLYNMGHVVRSIRERERKKRNKKKRRRSSWNKQRRKSFSFAVRKKKKEKSAHLLLSSCTPQVYVDTWPRRRHLRGRLD